ncbi:MAG TPA: hypothetical protein VMI52_07180 [Acetobacteraceae bacterium]|nr:hypothetical protein [Acetobacteraceae bacterium]
MDQYSSEMTVVMDGVRYTASYSTDGGVLTVRHPDLGNLSDRLGAVPPTTLARILLRQLARKAHAEPV